MLNVGCIPKKLMHFASTSGELRHDQIECGWEVDGSGAHNWEKMLENVNNYIRALNWGYKKTFISEKIKFIPKLASFIDNHTIKLVDAKGKEDKITAKHIVIATGGRPTYLDVPGLKENCITSDDLFWQKKAPGKTLVIGAGYIALECGGFIKGMGHEVAVMVRSVPLRNFDQDMVGKIVEKMEELGVRFLNQTNPISFEKLENGKILAKWSANGLPTVFEEEFDTILLATGRTPDLSGLNLEAVNIELKWSKVVVDKHNRTSTENIFAIGDIIVGSPELTPVAIKEGIYLADYLYANSTKTVNYGLIATTIFTPLEYSCIGLSEEKAIEKFGDENVEVYHTSFKPLEWNFLKTHKENLCYVKLIVNTADNEKVIGLHYAGPNAGEVMQGYAVAVTAGLTKQAWDDTIGIHPTCSEEFVTLKTTKRENPNVEKAGC